MRVRIYAGPDTLLTGANGRAVPQDLADQLARHASRALYVYVYVHTFTYIYTNLHVYVYVHTGIYVRIYTYVYVHAGANGRAVPQDLADRLARDAAGAARCLPPGRPAHGWVCRNTIYQQKHTYTKICIYIFIYI